MAAPNGIRLYDSGYAVQIPLGNVVAPTLINSYSALTIPAYWRAVNFLSNNLASFPRAVYSDGKLQGHALDKLLKRRPNLYQTATVFWRTWFFHAVHCGNGYARINRDLNYGVASLEILLPDDVTPFRMDGRPWFYQHSAKTPIAGADVLFLPGLGFDGMQGYSPATLLADTFQRAKSTEKYQTTYIQKGTVIRGSIEIPAGVTEERAEQIVATVRQFFRGPEAERDVIVLSDGAKLNNTTISPQASQLHEQTTDIVKAISQITGVPPWFLFDQSESKYNNSVEMAGLDVVRYCFRPWIELAEDELTTKLLDEGEQERGATIKINPDSLLRGDTATQTSTLVAKVNGGLMTRNEARELLDLPADPDPRSDQLTTLGDTTPQADRQANSTQPTSTNPTEALRPVLQAAIDRVEAKTSKAFEARTQKPADERIAWSNVFADQQAAFTVEALGPVADAYQHLGGPALDVVKLGGRYAHEIRKRAAGREAQSLAQLIEGTNHE